MRKEMRSTKSGTVKLPEVKCCTETEDEGTEKFGKGCVHLGKVTCVVRVLTALKSDLFDQKVAFANGMIHTHGVKHKATGSQD